HEVVGVSEIDKFALKSYEAIHGDCPNFGDISKIDVNDLPDMDLFTYSFPCQDLSVAGKQRGMGEGTRSGLLYECEKVIEAKRPKYLLLENVKNLVGKKFKGEFDEWLEYLEGLGYRNYWKVLNAKDYGVPQNRERVFVVSILSSKGYEFPQPAKLDKSIMDILENEVDEKYYMNKPFKLVNKGHVAELNMAGNDQIKRVYGCEGSSPCLNTMQGGHREPKILKVYEDSCRVRKLTPLECWRLMSFTDEDFYKAMSVGISNYQLYKQAGNSIVVKVLEGIFRNMFIGSNEIREITSETVLLGKKKK
ncbi:MAG: DNA cytosine methyltransferase, partial [Peptostreptococcaceae bacterium]